MPPPCKSIGLETVSYIPVRYHSVARDGTVAI